MPAMMASLSMAWLMAWRTSLLPSGPMGAMPMK
jgi:hypothetical protein